MSDLPYSGAGQGRTLKLFRPPNVGPNAALSGITTLQARSRQVARDDPWGVAVLDKRVANGIGCGIQRKIKYGTEAERLAAKALWESWIKYADADGVHDWYGLQSLGWREWDEAGECFARIRPRRLSDGLPVPMQLQLIESEQCPRNYNSTAPRTGNRIRSGIEFNALGRRVAYWMYPEHPGDGVVNGFVDGQLRRIPAEQIIHLYRPTRAGQLRGVPKSASVLVSMHKRKMLDENTMTRQEVASLFSVFYTREKGSSPYSPTDDMQTDTDTDGSPIAGLEPGLGHELPEGVDVKFSNPPAPGNDYNEFMRQRLMEICAAHAVPYEVVTGDLRGVSDRALKLVLTEFRLAIECDQWLCMIPQFCQRVAEAWTDAAVLSGALVIPGYADIRDQATASLWVPQGWPWSHPVQDVAATTNAIRAGLITRTSAIMTAGGDPEETDAQNAADNARADAAGLSYDSDGRRPRNAPNPEPTNETQQDANQ